MKYKVDDHNNFYRQVTKLIYQLFYKRSYQSDKTTTVNLNVVFLLTNLKKFGFCDGMKWIQSEFVT